jgi:RNA polymerase sigma-70 factor (ECF subfamily)
MTETEVADLYGRYGYVLFRRCLAYLGEEAAAQDAVQEVFVRALRSASGFRGDAQPSTWLRRIADHHCVDLLRRSRRNPVESEAALPEGEDGPVATSAWTRADEPDAVVAAHRLMRALDPDSRQLAVLYYLDEMTQDEIARETGISRKTIGKRLRALGVRARSLIDDAEGTP